eukprot:gene11329-23713_t
MLFRKLSGACIGEIRNNNRRYLSSIFENLKEEISKIKIENEEDRSWIKAGDAQKQISACKVIPSDYICESNLISYLNRRGYSSVLNTPQAVRTLSSLFTFPTTLSFGLNNIFRGHREEVSITIIGARAEHSLPRSWWLETLISSKNIKRLNITMMGPGILHSNPTFHKDSIISWHKENNTVTDTISSPHNDNIHTVSITTLPQGQLQLHKHPQAYDILLKSDVFVCFHPGFGSAAHKESWIPTLQLLLETKKPILCTAHGPEDLNTDMDALINLAAIEDNQDL